MVGQVRWCRAGDHAFSCDLGLGHTGPHQALDTYNAVVWSWPHGEGTEDAAGMPLIPGAPVCALGAGHAGPHLTLAEVLGETPVDN